MVRAMDDDGLDALRGWRGRELHRVDVLDEVDSTNAEALRRIDRGEPADGVVLVARNQTAGRGSRGRAWSFRHGRSLAATALVGWPAAAPLVAATWLAALAVREAAIRLGAPAAIEWPNDLTIGGAKFAGVLAEVRSRASTAVAIGIGVNVAHARDELPAGCATPPTSLALHGGVRPPGAFARELLESLDRRLAALRRDGAAAPAAEFLDATGLAGATALARVADQTLAGRVEALDAAGMLHLATRDGRRVVAAAHVASLAAWREPA